MTEETLMSLFIVQITPFRQNCTIVVCNKTKRCAVIDPGGEIELILSEIKRRGLTVEKIWITHGHLDHGGGAKAFKAATGAVIEGPNEADAFWVQSISQDAARYGIEGMESFEPDRWLKDGDTVSVGDLSFQVIHCPGHTPGSVVYYNKESNFAQVGDVLFRNSIGRTDLPRSNPADLIKSITQKLWPLGDVEFIPGHGGPSSFAKERENNPFVGDKVLAVM
ncbi:MAG: MBL fold metallo-hydrolase [Alphaproteobacteria bacterium]|nr:MBL fold metallo-hydrolase [Alphaproteobacteria bacterium]